MYFTRAFQALNTKTRRSYSEAFIYLKSLKIISRMAVYQESLALPVRLNSLTSGICNLGELVQQTQAQTGSRGFYLTYSLEKFSKFLPKGWLAHLVRRFAGNSQCKFKSTRSQCQTTVTKTQYQLIKYKPTNIVSSINHSNGNSIRW